MSENGRKITQEDEMRLKRLQDAVMAEFVRLKDVADPCGEEAEAAVRAWQKFLSVNFGDCPDYVLFTLGKAYALPEIAEKIDEYGEGTAKFMSLAIAAIEEASAKKK